LTDSPHPLLLGSQRPRHLWVPEYDTTLGPEAIELCAMAGLFLDEWQQFVLTILLALRDGKWAAFEAALEVARQNGKGGVYEARELAGLFLLGEKQLVHCAHEQKTSDKALDRMEAIIEGCPDLSRRVKSIKRSNTHEGVYLKTGAELRYTTRTSGGLRGWSCDFLGLDEAMDIKETAHTSVFPTMAARPNPQIFYAGSAVDQQTMSDGVVFARLRERGIRGGDQRLAYFGWSAPFDHPDQVTQEAARDPHHWAAANPAYGIRITRDYIEKEQGAMSARGFRVERLGVGDWPDTSEAGEMVIAIEKWRALVDTASRALDPVCFALDIRPDRSSAAIAAAGKRADGLRHVEIVDRRPGTDWIVDRAVELTARHKHVGLVVDPASPAASLINDLNQRLNFEVTEVTANEHGQACGMIYDACEQATLRHLGTPELDSASGAPPSARSATCGCGRARPQASTSARSSPPPSRTGAAQSARRAGSRWSHGADPQDAHGHGDLQGARARPGRRPGAGDPQDGRRRAHARRRRRGDDRDRADLRAGGADRRRRRAHRVRAAGRRRRPAQGPAMTNLLSSLRSNPAISLDQAIAQVMGFNGMQYPLLGRQTLGSKTEEISADFQGIIEGAYKSNGVIFACMLARQLLFTEARFQYRRIRNGRPGELFGNSTLSVLEKPWQNATTGDLLARAIQDVDLEGNFYGAIQSGKRGRYVARMRPDWVTIILGSNSDPAAAGWALDAEIAGYAYTPGGHGSGRKPQLLLPEQVAHFAPVPDPAFRFRGMSWITPVIREVMADGAATAHKLQFFENGATPNLVVSMDAEIQREEFQRWIELMDQQTAGILNAYKTLYLGAGSTAQVVGADMKQIDFKVTQGAGETRIAAAAGVPPVIVGLSEGLQAATYSNYSQARRRFADGTIRPLWRNMAGSLATLVDVPAGAELWYDDRDIPFLQEDQKDAAEIQGRESQTIKTLIDGGFTPASVVLAIESGNWSVLEHTGLFSVQLQPPGTSTPDAPAPDAPPPPAGT
jgi:phage portal protein BeeE